MVGAAQAAEAPEITPPAIHSVQIFTPRVARYEKFEAEFEVDTRASQPSFPFEANPPRGIPPGTGISVDVLFSNDDWETTVVQPAFWYQPVRYADAGSRDYLLPKGAPRWRVRFAPQTIGAWQFRIRAQDRGGASTFPRAGAFRFDVFPGAEERDDSVRVNPSTRHGFLRVSPKDPRYFEFQDGTPFLGLGYNVPLETIGQMRQRFRAWQANGLQFARVWMSMSGMNGSQWTPWAFPGQVFNASTPQVLVDSQETFDGADLAFRLDQKNPCVLADFWQGGIAVEPNTTYSVTLRAKLSGVTPQPGGADAGLTVLNAGWAPECSETPGAPIVPPRVGTTDWYTATGTLSTRGDQLFLDFLQLALRKTSQGTAYIDSITLTARNDPDRVNLLRRPRADSHLYFDSINAAKWDLLIQAAEEYGVYLKLVTDEKNEWIRNQIQADASFGKYDNNNFYAAPNTKVRWLEQAWWRYLIARWGYSTAIHSFEYVNEGDPFNGNHYNAAGAMAEYFDAHDPSQHMVTTSFWHSFPGREFWTNPKFAALDYADLHAYITTGWQPDASFVPPKFLETRPAFVHSGKASFRIRAAETLNQQITPRGVTLNEPGEWVIRYWMKAEKFQARCTSGSTGGQQRVQWVLDGDLGEGGKSGYVPYDAQLKGNVCGSPAGTFDWRTFSSQQDRSGKAIPLTHRLVINDTQPHELKLFIQNAGGVSGDAWIDDVEIISPSGVRIPVIGDFDNTSTTQDTAWLTAAYSLVWGGASPAGAHKPLVRGETGLNSAEFPDGLPEVNQDKQGIWLHNFVWGQINPGGMYDLYWWGKDTIENNPKTGRAGNLFTHFASFAKFMADVPINNGHYRDAQAVTSDPRLRAWGQRDDVNGRAHLWIQNTDHTWTNVIAGKTIKPISGKITLANFKPGAYEVTWWDPYKLDKLVFKQEMLTNRGGLTMTLPAPLTTDVAVQLRWVQP